MTSKKDEALQEILKDFEKISNLVLEQMDLLEDILTSGTIDVSDEILKKIHQYEKDIDKRELKLSDKITNAIVLYHPVASELRKIMACYRILISLERIGDLVLNVTRIIRKIKAPEVYGKLQELLHNMTIQSNRMVKKSLLSYLNDDRDLAIWTLKNEDLIDDSNQKLLKKSLSVKGTEEWNKHLISSIITIKEMMANIERIADHASNIAESAMYSMEGKEIRHHKIPE